MAQRKADAERTAELEIALRIRDAKIKELTEERDEALELVNKMREHTQDASGLIDRWIDVFQMERGVNGDWLFDPSQSELWGKYDDLLKRHNQLIRDWNKFVPLYNSRVNPQGIGRPVAASESQKADILKRRRKGDSLRVIAAATSLSLRTVRTIVDNANNTGRAGNRSRDLPGRSSTGSELLPIGPGRNLGIAYQSRLASYRRQARPWSRSQRDWAIRGRDHGTWKKPMLQAHVTPLPLALVAAVHAVCLFALVTALRTPAPQFPGWRVVRPGGTQWFCFVGCWTFAALVSWVWLFVGSARHDAEMQMRWALLLILAFGIGAAWSGFYIAQLCRIMLRWRGPVIRWREGNRDIVKAWAITMAPAAPSVGCFTCVSATAQS